jgi:hypothetical protein
MFGKAKCKVCGDSVRFALRHLEEKHPETLKDRDVIKLNMSKIMEKFFLNNTTALVFTVYNCNSCNGSCHTTTCIKVVLFLHTLQC